MRGHGSSGHTARAEVMTAVMAHKVSSAIAIFLFALTVVGSSSVTSANRDGGSHITTSSSTSTAGGAVGSHGSAVTLQRALQAVAEPGRPSTPSEAIGTPAGTPHRYDGDDGGGGGKGNGWSDVRRKMTSLMQLPAQVAPPLANTSRPPRLAFGIHGERLS